MIRKAYLEQLFFVGFRIMACFAAEWRIALMGLRLLISHIWNPIPGAALGFSLSVNRKSGLQLPKQSANAGMDLPLLC